MAKTAVADPIDLVPGSTPVTGIPLAPLPEPTLRQLLDGLRSLSSVVDAALNRLPEIFISHLGTLSDRLMAATGDLSPSEAGALQHLCDTLQTLGERGLRLTKPYAVQIAVKTPGGFPATMTIERTDSKEFFAALADMTGWLAENHYVPL